MQPELKERMVIKQARIKDKAIINNLKSLHFHGFVSEEIKKRINTVLSPLSSYDAKPEKVIITEADSEANIKNLENIIKEIQKDGRWLIPSPVYISNEWYEVEASSIKQGIKELFGLYVKDYFTVVLKEKEILTDVFWDEEYNGIYSPDGVYCIFIKKI